MEVEEFRRVVKRTKTCKEDSDGRRKLMARRELAYIYHMSSQDSVYYNSDEKQRHQRLCQDLFGDPQWEADEVVKAAIVKYKDLTKTPSSFFVDTITQTLHKSERVINVLINELEDKIERKTYKQDVINKSGMVKTGIQILLDDVSALMKVGKDIPPLLRELEQVREKVEKEKSMKSGKIRANLTISSREE